MPYRVLLTSLLFMGCAMPANDGDFVRREGLFRLVLVPDTQCYARFYPEILEAQGSWIARNAAELDIRAAAHLGDVTDRNDRAEWEIASAALRPVQALLPFALSPGNHDLGAGGTASDRGSMLGAFFPVSEMAAQADFVESFEGAPGNTAWLFSGEIHDYLLIGLEFAPRDAVVAWARDVLSAHPGRIGVLATHAYLDAEGRRYDHADETPQEFCPYEYGVAAVDANDGQELFLGAVAPAENTRLVFSGHVPNGFAHTVDMNDAGHAVHQVMADYQTGTRCPEEGGDGEGFLLVVEMEEDAAGVAVRVRSYSPWLDSIREDHTAEFRIDAP